jgi:adenine deaminase
VPASHFESPAAEFSSAELRELLDEHGAIGIAEFMDFPGVVSGDPEVLAKIATAGHKRVDGHAPGVVGRQLDAYLAAGIESDHECTQLEEAEEKRRKGMWIFIREGSASRNLAALIETVLRHGTDRVALCTDDREPDTLLHSGHVNDCVRLAVAAGVSTEDALVMATSNPADYHHFDHLGWLAPGYQADVLCFDDLSSFEPARVWPGGRARVIGIESRSLTTRGLVLDVTDPSVQVARIAVVERHRRTGRIGLGYVQGFGLTHGAIASTVAHDAHNCMVVGALDDSGPAEMAVAVARLAEIGGGQLAVRDGQVLAEVRLPIGGLMSDQSIEEVAGEVRLLAEAASNGLGVTIDSPFMQLSFLGLSVLPELRITDKGLVDVMKFALTDVAAT